MSNDAHPPNRTRSERRVLARDDYRCRHCDRRGGPDGAVVLRVRHVVPPSRGGSHHPRNLQSVCRRCDQRVSEHHLLGSEARVAERITRRRTGGPSGTGGGVSRAVLVGAFLWALLLPLLVAVL